MLLKQKKFIGTEQQAAWPREKLKDYLKGKRIYSIVFSHISNLKLRKHVNNLSAYKFNALMILMIFVVTFKYKKYMRLP